eukprot:TRINITY_DN13222_c0_g1_i1.p1 TRINITY_DN13222_c0_g1~~TRINITY_DN13222_c0_g1_i1.p1  ORF type:complete len:500 (+),score=57.40 TRINITY_DN13222_c0_g1_i1:133-1632(+)
MMSLDYMEDYYGEDLFPRNEARKQDLQGMDLQSNPTKNQRNKRTLPKMKRKAESQSKSPPPLLREDSKASSGGGGGEIYSMRGQPPMGRKLIDFEAEVGEEKQYIIQTNTKKLAINGSGARKSLSPTRISAASKKHDDGNTKSKMMVPKLTRLLNASPEGNPSSRYPFFSRLRQMDHFDPQHVVTFINHFLGYTNLQLRSSENIVIVLIAYRPATKIDQPESVIIKAKSYQNFNQLNHDMREVYTMMRISSGNPNFTKYLDCKFSADDNGRFYLYTITEQMRETLESDIRKRKKKANYLTEEEFFSLFCSIISALNFLHKNGIHHGNLKSTNIFLDTLSNYRIGEINQGEKATKGNPDRSPKMRANTKKVNERTETTLKEGNLYKADIFAAGLILLETGTLSSNEDLASSDPTKFRKENLTDKVNSLFKIYKKDLGSIVAQMVKGTDEERPPITVIKQKLRSLQDRYNVIARISDDEDLQSLLSLSCLLYTSPSPRDQA